MKLFKDQKGFGLIEGLLLVIALTLIGGVGYYVYDRQNSNDEEPQTTKVEPVENTDKSLAEEETLPPLVDYGIEGVEIAKKADVKKLYDASDNFKDYLASQVKENSPAGTDCDATVYTVYKIAEDKFASGASGSVCGGGGGVIWSKQSGSWDAVLGYQDTPGCQEVNKFKIPATILKTCMDFGSASGPKEIQNPN